MDKEKIICSILEESPFYSVLPLEEKRVLIHDLLSAYSELFELKNTADIEEDSGDWFKRRL
jgi:hypothetical protein